MCRKLGFMLVWIIVAASTYGDPSDIVNKIVNPSWLEQTALKLGFVSSLCAFQALNGVVEGYHFRQGKDTHFINSGNYHAFVTAQRLAGISAGWFGYANYRNKQQTVGGKICRLAGSIMLARNCMEWSYKATRYGNPFDYSEKRNEHAIVYFGVRKGKLVDLYISTGGITGPLVDMGFLAGGLLLLR